MTRHLIAAGCLAGCLAVGLMAGPAADADAGATAEGPKQLAYGLHFMKAKDYPRAIVHLTEAIQAHALEPERLSDAYYFRGRALVRTQRPDLALADFTQAVAFWPKNVKALRVRCRALTLKGELPDALADCDRAVELAPEDWRGWFTRGLLREARSERNLALIDFTASQARMPKGLETFPTIARQLKAYGLLTDGTDTKDGAPPLPVWQEE
ncbi:tetratricopeptide repeat protein [Thalassospiraceae bacterium LMO-SO8]|nr:tetratricopeptide repeat protein [Alphaproteobacteria bacterium LMO-S08]WND77117.1 tetratricopeptide repeat protein [Thalassospiraceae bacterium LMO-SO8]